MESLNSCQQAYIPVSGFRIFSFFLFILLLIYLVLRGLYNEPVLDELSTFSYYIQSHEPLNRDIPPDANNHLLNTFFG